MSCDPLVAGIGLLILAGLAWIVGLNPHQQRIQSARIDRPEGE